MELSGRLRGPGVTTVPLNWVSLHKSGTRVLTNTTVGWGRMFGSARMGPVAAHLPFWKTTGPS